MAIDRSKFQSRQRKMPDHMANLDKLVPGSLRGARAAVLTITDAVIVDAKRGEDRKTGDVKYEPAVVLRFQEFPNRIYWVNKMGVNILCDVYGEEEQAWIGERVPLQVAEDVKNPTENTRNDMLWVANADEWPRLFDEDETARAKSPTAAAPIENKAAAAAREAAAKRKKTPSKNA